MHISQVQYVAARLRSRTILSVLKQATSSTAATHVSYPTRTHTAATYVVPASITIRKYRHLIANSLCISSTAQTPHIEYVSATVSHVQAVAHTLEHTTGGGLGVRVLVSIERLIDFLAIFRFYRTLNIETEQCIIIAS